MNSNCAKNILIISPEAWAAHPVSKHNYAKALAQIGHTIFFLNPPQSAVTELCVTPDTDSKGVFIVDMPVVAKGLRFMPAFLRIFLERRWLSSLETLVGRRIDVIWLFENSRFFDLRFAESRFKIYHQVDLNQRFNHELAAKTADICFCHAEVVKNELSRFRNDVFKIQHGLVLSSEDRHSTDSFSDKFASGRVNCIYVGNLDMAYLDVDLLSRLVRQHADIVFHFVGGFSENAALRMATEKFTNIVWWGKVPSNVIPDLLSMADVCLVTYKHEHWRDQASPHKLMEYFSSGKVCVATYTDEYSDKRHLLEMIDRDGDYLEKFNEVVTHLGFYNDDRRRTARIQYAAEHSYHRQLERIDSILLDQGFGSFRLMDHS